MTLQELNAYIKDANADFEAGIKLLEICDPKSTSIKYYRNNLNSVPGSMPWNMLKNDLARHLRIFSGNPKLLPTQSVNAPQKAQNTSVKSPTSKIGTPKIEIKGKVERVDLGKLPEDKKELDAENKKIGRQMTTLNEKRKLLVDNNGSKEEIAQITKEIVSLENRRNDILAIIDGKKENPSDPAKQEGKISLDDQIKKINSAKKYISRNYNSENEKTLAEVRKREDFLKECNIEFNPKSAK
jgi:hypothetical protein